MKPNREGARNRSEPDPKAATLRYRMARGASLEIVNQSVSPPNLPGPWRAVGSGCSRGSCQAHAPSYTISPCSGAQQGSGLPPRDTSAFFARRSVARLMIPRSIFLDRRRHAGAAQRRCERSRPGCRFHLGNFSAPCAHLWEVLAFLLPTAYCLLPTRLRLSRVRRGSCRPWCGRASGPISHYVNWISACRPDNRRNREKFRISLSSKRLWHVGRTIGISGNNALSHYLL